MSLGFLTSGIHFFGPPQIMVLVTFLGLNLNGGVIQMDSRGQIGAFLASRNFFFKNHGKIKEKRKVAENGQKSQKMKFFGFHTIFAIFLLPGHLKRAEGAIFGVFRPFSAILGTPLPGQKKLSETNSNRNISV